ncbi:MAG: nuclear transport factor 2 family protein [Marinobacter sp.]|uniref:nuclear transport factor 2 family protein n=1 Tax=Marinobacter sp. TaxID=50741 RepID=UPI00349FEA98
MTQPQGRTGAHVSPGTQTSLVVERFKTLFNQMSSNDLGSMSEVYHPEVTFTDPFVTVQGVDALEEYFNGAYENVIECYFEFSDPISSGDNVCLPWVMKLRHKRIRRGELIAVDGITRLHLEDGLVKTHRDYFDAGQLLYENLPVLGSAVRWLRKHAA